MAQFDVNRKPTTIDVVELVDNMRPADRKECELATGMDASGAVQISIGFSSYVAAVRVDGRLACIYGVCPSVLDPRVGIPWMLGTPEMDKWPVVIMKVSKACVEDMLKVYHELINWVHADNKRAIAWLKHLGFEVGEPAPYGPRNAQFCQFRQRRRIQIYV